MREGGRSVSGGGGGACRNPRGLPKRPSGNTRNHRLAPNHTRKGVDGWRQIHVVRLIDGGIEC